MERMGPLSGSPISNNENSNLLKLRPCTCNNGHHANISDCPNQASRPNPPTQKFQWDHPFPNKLHPRHPADQPRPFRRPSDPMYAADLISFCYDEKVLPPLPASPIQQRQLPQFQQPGMHMVRPQLQPRNVRDEVSDVNNNFRRPQKPFPGIDRHPKALVEHRNLVAGAKMGENVGDRRFTSVFNSSSSSNTSLILTRSRSNTQSLVKTAHSGMATKVKLPTGASTKPVGLLSQMFSKLRNKELNPQGSIVEAEDGGIDEVDKKHADFVQPQAANSTYSESPTDGWDIEKQRIHTITCKDCRLEREMTDEEVKEMREMRNALKGCMFEHCDCGGNFVWL